MGKKFIFYIKFVLKSNSVLYWKICIITCKREKKWKNSCSENPKIVFFIHFRVQKISFQKNFFSSFFCKSTFYIVYKHVKFKNHETLHKVTPFDSTYFCKKMLYFFHDKSEFIADWKIHDLFGSTMSNYDTKCDYRGAFN